ncbi:MAG: chemotaxis protein CheA, partial [Planctomycetota bacterium]
MINDLNGPGDSMSEQDFSDYLPLYLDETEEQLDDLVETMLSLEQNPGDKPSLQTAFRLLHSMKGASGMMGLDQITVLTHHLETRFERLRSGTLELDRVTMNLTLRCIDFLKTCNDQVRKGQPISTPEQLLSELHELEEASEKASEQDASASQPADAGVAEIIAEVTGVFAEEVPGGEATDTTKVEPPNPQTSSQESSDDAEDDEATSASDDVPIVFHLVLDFRAEVLERGKVTHALDLLQSLRPMGEILATRPEESEFESIDETLDVILQIDPAGFSPAPEVDQTFAERLCARVVDLAEGLQRLQVRTPRATDAEPLATWDHPPVTKQDALEETAAADEEKGPGNEPVDDQVDTSTDGGSDDVRTHRPATVHRPTKVAETMRVEIGRLDHLMNLAGELVVNRSQFAQVAGELSAGAVQARFGKKADRVTRTREFCDRLSQTLNCLRGGESPDPELVRELDEGLTWIRQQSEIWESNRSGFNRLDEAIDQLARISDSLQRGVLGTRMVPIGPLLNRFRRTVRDLSLQFSKEVELTVEGETTELDKRMIDALSDPITHLIRNALDHGLESPEERVAAGKPERGTIVLSARHSGNQVLIVVRDDGRGIDSRRIRDSLVKKQLMTRVQADALSEDDAIASIFHPGFSTASAVTDVSGRGVGMDIVKATITDLNGTIDIDTAVGLGTTFTIQLPLTLAIIGSLLFRMGRVTFAIPKDDVREIVSVPKSKIVELHGKRTFEVRGVYLPLIRITEVL